MPYYHYVNTPVIAMRQHPDAASEVVSEAFFSEEIHIIEESGDWVLAETSVDKYPGWIKREAIFSRSSQFFSQGGKSDINAWVNRCSAHLYHVEDTIFGPVLTLPFESRMKVIEPIDTALDSRWIKVALHSNKEAYIQRGDVTFTSVKLDHFDLLCDFSQRFLGLPYTWGGRSSFGYDCSGYVQMLYRQMGIHLPRDAKDQCVWQGFNEVQTDQIKSGDLIFFGLDSQKIKHVGMYLRDGKFIHATVSENAPYIHISELEGKDWRGDGAGRYPFRVTRRLKGF